MNIKQLLFSTAVFVCASAPAHADALTDFFEIAAGLAKSTENLVQEKNSNGDVTQVTGTVDGKQVVFTPDVPLSQNTKSANITTVTNGNTTTVKVSTEGTGLRDVNPGDAIVVSGQVDGVSVEIEAPAPAKSDSKFVGTLNGNPFEASLPDGSSFEEFDSDQDVIVVKKDGKEIFSGVLSDITDVEEATLASEFEAVSTNPLNTMASQAASLGGFFGLVSRGALSFGVDGFTFNVAPSNNQKATHGYSPQGPTIDDSWFIYGAWGHASYNDRSIENSIGTFDTKLTTTAFGAHAVVNEDYLVGMAGGLQFADGETRGTTSRTNTDVVMFSPYVGARFLDGHLIVESALIYGLVDLDTQRAGTISGNTRGHRFGGRTAVGYSRAISDRFSVMTKAGLMIGYDRYDAFTESNGTVVDEFEIGVGIFDISLSGKYQVNEQLAVRASAKGIFDFSNDIINNSIVDQFNNAGFELSSGISYQVNERVTADLNGSFEVGKNYSLAGKGINGTIRISF